MTALLLSELLKQRSTRTNLGLFLAMLGLVVLAILLHGLGLPAQDLARRKSQLMVFGRGELLGALFAALLGAMSITAEFRHGTIRPTFLATPQRGRVVAAKVWASLLTGVVFGLIAVTVAAVVGSAVLAARGVKLQLEGGDLAVLIAGGAAAAALWAAIGVGVGAAVRHQVPTVVGIAAWLLFVEGLLGADAGSFGNVGRYLPGALASAASGQVPQLAPGLAAVLLALYAVAAAAAGWAVTTRGDVA